MCPADSSIRELIAEPLIAVNSEEDVHQNLLNLTEISEELFSQCCLNKKCICNLCHIPDCHREGEVVVELQPESNDLPGFCCGKYECQIEPNCTDVQNTDNYWLTNCQRCKCRGGHRLCYQSCDEGVKKEAMCHIENTNTFYEHGQSWRDGCYECECVNGKSDCTITLCKGLNCPKNRQVQLKDSCCPVCWPKGFAMPNTDDKYDEETELDNNETETGGQHYDNNEDYDENEEQIEPDIELKPINDIGKPLSIENSTTTTSTVKPSAATTKIENLFSSTMPTNISVPCKIDNPASSTPEPCQRNEVPATYQVYPQVVELMRYSQHNNLLYTIIGCLSVLVVILAAWNIHLKAKQRSYRPVSNFDDNFNRMSSNIKKMNDYV